METITPLSLFKALAEPTRFHSILLLLSEPSLCVCELEFALEEEQPKISRHLALLRKQELLITMRQHKWVYYQINPALPQWVHELLAIMLANEQALLTRLKNNLTAMQDRPNACQV